MPEDGAEQLSFAPPSPVAAAATTIDCASIILPITPPVELAEAMRIGSSPNFSAVIFWRLPKRTLLDVSEPVRATPSQPSSVPKIG